MTGHICLSPCYSLLHSLPFFSSRSSYSNSPCRTGALGQLLLSQADERAQIFVAFCGRLWVDVGHNEPRQKNPKKPTEKCTKTRTEPEHFRGGWDGVLGKCNCHVFHLCRHPRGMVIRAGPRASHLQSSLCGISNYVLINKSGMSESLHVSR